MIFQTWGPLYQNLPTYQFITVKALNLFCSERMSHLSNSAFAMFTCACGSVDQAPLEHSLEPGAQVEPLGAPGNRDEQFGQRQLPVICQQGEHVLKVSRWWQPDILKYNGHSYRCVQLTFSDIFPLISTESYSNQWSGHRNIRMGWEIRKFVGCI